MALLVVAAIDTGKFKRYDTVDVFPDVISDLSEYRLPTYHLFRLPGEYCDYAYLKDPLIIPENSADAFASERECFYNFDQHISNARLEEIQNAEEPLIVDILELDIERKERV